MSDLVIDALRAVQGADVRRGELPRGDRVLRWIEAGSGQPAVVYDAALGEPGTLGCAGFLPLVAPRLRMIAYDRAGIGISDPSWPLTLDGQVDDFVAVAQATGGPAILVGHSWGGLLALLAETRHPGTAAGLILLDPADEDYWVMLPPEHHERTAELGAAVISQQASGELGGTVRDSFGAYAQNLTGDVRLREQFLDAYASCYTTASQARMVQGEFDLFNASLQLIHQIRADLPLPSVPVIILSATTGSPPEQRELCTGLHADLAAALPTGRHVVLPDTSHAMNQERPAEIASAILEVAGVGPLSG
jgi:pimeloyl-ACP methyl ester carboxylesterase